ncbi:DDE-type integrase/transposase/recombinase [Actinomadura sp. 6N118]|uniref:DDE-type integrase/transposase/recombinase n=1 Tax=Actinomadura sp. 6N118 TaxID=3375151 RepID=UPI0037A22455
MHLASILDLHSRRCVGFAVSAPHDAALAKAALQVAIAVRGGEVPGVVMHTDQGWRAVQTGMHRRRHHPIDGPHRLRPGQRGR